MAALILATDGLTLYSVSIIEISGDFPIFRRQELDYKEFKMFAMACIDKQNEIDRKKREKIERRRRQKMEKARRKIEQIELARSGGAGLLTHRIPSCESCTIQ